MTTLLHHDPFVHSHAGRALGFSCLRAVASRALCVVEGYIAFLHFPSLSSRPHLPESFLRAAVRTSAAQWRDRGYTATHFRWNTSLLNLRKDPTNAPLPRIPETLEPPRPRRRWRRHRRTKNPRPPRSRRPRPRYLSQTQPRRHRTGSAPARSIGPPNHSNPTISSTPF